MFHDDGLSQQVDSVRSIVNILIHNRADLDEVLYYLAAQIDSLALELARLAEELRDS